MLSLSYPTKHVTLIIQNKSEFSKKMKVIKVKYKKLLNYINNLVMLLQEIQKFLKRAVISLSNINDIINKVVSHCKTCQQYKKPVPRPTIGLPKANYFNDTVAMDTSIRTKFMVFTLN